MTPLAADLSAQREAQAKYSERRATRTERVVPLELPVQAQEQSQCSSDEQEPEPISSGKVQPTRYYDWEGQELDVKITDKVRELSCRAATLAASNDPS